ncbi:MAG: hypothetical protein RSC66_09895, partial [Comamonas sp.]
VSIGHKPAIVAVWLGSCPVRVCFFTGVEAEAHFVNKRQKYLFIVLRPVRSHPQKMPKNQRFLPALCCSIVGRRLRACHPHSRLPRHLPAVFARSLRPHNKGGFGGLQAWHLGVDWRLACKLHEVCISLSISPKPAMASACA